MAANAGESLWWVNRIDKVTSGAVVLAKTKKAQGALTRQFAKRTVDKAYLAICQPGGLPNKGAIDLPLLTAGNGRVRVAAERQSIEYEKTTGTWHVQSNNLISAKHFTSRTNYINLWDDGRNVLILAMPVTGRRHQIRVYLAWVGHAIVGDPLFIKKADPPEPRTYLHSLRVAFETADPPFKRVEVEARPSSDFWEPIRERFASHTQDELFVMAGAKISAH